MDKNTKIIALIQEKIFNFVSLYNAIFEFCRNIIRDNTLIFKIIAMIVSFLTGIIPIITFVGILLLPYILFYKVEAEKERKRRKLVVMQFIVLVKKMRGEPNPLNEDFVYQQIIDLVCPEDKKVLELLEMPHVSTDIVLERVNKRYEQARRIDVLAKEYECYDQISS